MLPIPPNYQYQPRAALDPPAGAAPAVLQVYTVWGLPMPVSILEDSARVVGVAGTSLTEETT